MGRISAILTEFFSILEKIEQENKKTEQAVKNFFSFFWQCQKKWGFFPCSYLIKQLAGRGGGFAPFRSFAIELCMALIFVLLFRSLGWQYVLAEYLIFTFALVTASAVDLEHKILPDSLTLSGILIGLAGALLNPAYDREFWPALAGVLMGGGFLWLIAVCYYAFRKEEGLGGGDIKLLAWIGAVLTWKAVPFVILLSCFAGLLAGLVMVIFSRSKGYLQQSLPFGPYLGFSALIYILYGEKLAHSYLSLFFPQI